jgi:glyoxylase-like metal-dependent hydrolase (beta-lactamase superfamily II)
VVTHAHQDHWGLADQALPSVPLYMGEATHRILKEVAFWVSGLTRPQDQERRYDPASARPQPTS